MASCDVFLTDLRKNVYNHRVPRVPLIPAKPKIAEMESPAPSAPAKESKSLMEVSMALLVACAEQELLKAKEQHIQRIDKMFKKLSKSRENLAQLDKRLRLVKEKDDILAPIEDNSSRINELTQNLEETSQKLNAMKNCNLEWGEEKQVEIGRTEEVAEIMEKDVRALTEAVKLFVKSTDSFVQENNGWIDNVMEIPVDFE